jgi:hypothetical protein
MFETIEDLKRFIEWASKMGVARAKIEDIEFEISPVKTAANMYEEPVVSKPSQILEEEEEILSSEEDIITAQAEAEEKRRREEQELLYHSSGR